MNIIIFTNDIYGHHIEYIHHLYIMAKDDHNNNYYFVLPSKFNNFRSTYIWPQANNILLELYEGGIENTRPSGFIEQIKYSLKVTLYIMHTAKKYNASRIYVNTLVDFLIFSPYFLWKKLKLYGVIYKIFLRVENISLIRLFLEKTIFFIASKSKIFGSIFVLNDRKSTNSLNKMFNTDKFVHLVDPFVPLRLESKKYNFRIKYNIRKEKKIFIHFGSLCKAKGTLDILESIIALNTEEKNNYAFVFAGLILEDIKYDFYQLVAKLNNQVQIIIIDEFCSLETLSAMFTSCDAILIPYRRTAQSSGVIGYASQFGKPVIAPQNGLLGELVVKYQLGIVIPQINSNNLIKAYSDIAKGRYRIPSQDYCDKNSITEFNNIIFNYLSRDL